MQMAGGSLNTPLTHPISQGLVIGNLFGPFFLILICSNTLTIDFVQEITSTKFDKYNMFFFYQVNLISTYIQKKYFILECSALLRGASF